MDILDKFSKELVSSLKKIFDSVKEYKSTITKKEKLWWNLTEIKCRWCQIFGSVFAEL